MKCDGDGRFETYKMFAQFTKVIEHKNIPKIFNFIIFNFLNRERKKLRFCRQIE